MNNIEKRDKRIAIINRFPNDYVGGIEIYLTVLMKGLLKEGYTIDFLYWKTDKQMISKSKHDSLRNEEVNYIQLYGNKLFPQRKLIKFVEKNIKNNYYDIVINNNWNIASKYLQSSDKVIRVQHNNWKRHDPTNRKLINKIGHKFGTMIGIDIEGNVLDDSYNTVFYSTYTDIKKIAKHSFYVPTPISSDFCSQIKDSSKPKEGAVWFNRLNDVGHKGLNNLIKIINNNNSIDVIGADPIREIKEHESYKGAIMRKNLFDTLNKYKVFCITSNFEGYPIVALEALTTGMPIIAFNTFDALTEWVEAGVAFSVEPGNIEEYNRQVETVLKMDKNDYDELSRRCIEYSKNFYPEIFQDKWNKIIDNVIMNSIDK